uniref:ORF4a n=1 Tax=Middle East respiratory syndrome-related coronavirus TaxID=1335626 RepID=A0A384VYF7_MERS|nr:NS4A protein [Middle East respiratory syndrome-related coronavirus]ARQ84759.1 NS4A protein [Middle East respiratory syndrome-related coronavirus]ASY99780.1 ORF4a [Middle East respiratory syndrome-related coronavirus]ASY99886.1 ORF4a [Middle East respiratory syndrome-related coronavirus]ASY99897.1 ORF4a [Middle East respiratory syndrome-related coronavirus]
MDYVSLLNQIWQKYLNSPYTTCLYIPKPTAKYTPFAGYTESAVNSTKALAKQDAAQRIAWLLHKDGGIPDGCSLYLRHSSLFAQSKEEESFSN